MKNKFKALITDFDGTLVDADFTLSPKVKDAIVKLVKRGIIFSVATGRPYQGIVKEICGSLNLSFPQIVNGGAQIIDPKKDKSIWTEFFSKNAVTGLIKYFLDKNYDFGVEGKDFLFKTKKRITAYGPDINFVDIKNIDYSKVLKMVLFDIASIDDPEKVEDKLNNLYPDLHFVRSRRGGAPYGLDITSAKATKHLAILELSKILNIDPKEMIGVGDGYNDYPLLSACGFKVAMENAPRELKEIADLIIPTAEKDGLVVVINKLLNNELPRSRAARYR